MRAAERVERAADRARRGGVAAVFHPHTATYIENPNEVAALLEATDPDLVKLAFDTGHTVVGGGDPVELAHAARDRIGHLHLKDVDPGALARVRSGELTVAEAWDAGMFCPFGEGSVDFAAVLARLHAMGSVTPAGPPRKSFSARWPSSAICTSSSGSANAARSARSIATSSAALDDRPPPSGTSDSTLASKPRMSSPIPRRAAVTPCT